MLVGPYRIGVDIGGTFTDLVLVDAKGAVRAFKSPSVPSDPADGVIAAVKLAARTLKIEVQDFLANTELFVHGSTIATNTLLEKKGAKQKGTRIRRQLGSGPRARTPAAAS